MSRAGDSVAMDEVAQGLDLRIGYAQRFTSDAGNFFRVVVETEFGERGER